ncbi:hypothetical protein AX14_013423 [Amanita brunnescens Koide BX004]|nr:hypothetical protein AX14_013423 [Amanita brunnescens Koide BX004]
MPSALLFGATGQVGQNVLKELLASSYFTRVGEYGRRLTNLDTITVGKEKLEQKAVDFEKIDRAGLKDGKWDVIFITLGTTINLAGSAEAFQKIDREYVINAARAARTSDPNQSQRIVYLSSVGANPSSCFLYTKSKGLTELGLAKVGYSDTIIFRPSLLKGTNRPDSRPLETIWGAVTGVAAYISNNVEIQVSTLAKSLVKAGIAGSSGLPNVAQASTEILEGTKFTVIGNAGAVEMAKEGST